MTMELTEEQIAQDSRTLLTYARRFDSELIDAEDVAQEVWREILETRPERGPGFRRWLSLAVRHAALREATRNRRRAERETTREHRYEEPASTIAARNSTRAWVGALVDALPVPYREVIRMRFLDELSTAEIARRLDRSPPLVRVQVQRGLTLLRTRAKRRESPWLSLSALWLLLRDSWRRPATSRLLAVGVVALCALPLALDHLLLEGRAAGEGPRWTPRPGGESRSALTAARVETAGRRIPVKDLVRGSGGLHLRLQEVDGAAVPDMPLLLTLLPSGPSAPTVLRTARTSKSGEARLELAPGRWRVQPHRGAAFDVDVREGRDVTRLARVREGLPVRAAPDAGIAGKLWVSFPDDPDRGHFVRASLEPGFPVTSIDPRSWIGIRQRSRGMSELVRVDSLERGPEGERTVRFAAAHRAKPLDGAVLDHRGRPVADAHVRVVSQRKEDPSLARGGRRWLPSRSTDLTEEDGSFELFKGPDQYSRVVVTTNELRQFVTRASSVRMRREHLVIQLPAPVTLRCRVWTSGGQPAARARVRCDLGDWTEPFHVRASDEGELEIHGLAPGTVELAAESEDGREALRLRCEVRGSPAVHDLFLQPDRPIAGLVLAEDGRPVANATVYLEPRASQEVRDTRHPLLREAAAATATTDESGRFRFSGLDPELYTLRAVSSAGVPVWTLLDVRPGSGETFVRAGPTGILTGRVELGGSLPVHRLFLDSLLLQTEIAVVPDPETGRFECAGLQPGSYRLIADLAGAGCSLLYEVEVEPHSLRDVGTLHLQVQGGLQVEIPSNLAARPSDLTELSLVYLDGPWPRKDRYALAPGGSITLDHLLPGAYRVEVQHRGMMTWRELVTIEPGLLTTVVPEVRHGSTVMLPLPPELAAREVVSVQLILDGAPYLSDLVDLSHTASIPATLSPGSHRLLLTVGDTWRAELDVFVP